jgi:hypothetical protein
MTQVAALNSATLLSKSGTKLRRLLSAVHVPIMQITEAHENLTSPVRKCDRGSIGSLRLRHVQQTRAESLFFVLFLADSQVLVDMCDRLGHMPRIDIAISRSDSRSPDS